jgi:toxin ParE1/3/4
MASRVHERRQARADLDRIWTYIAANNTKAADAMLERIRSVYKMLVQNPLAGRRRPEFGRNLRSFSFDNYLVFYIPQSGTIDIVPVMHGRQDIGPADMA